MIVVSDSGPLIALSRLGMLPILQELFGEIVIPEEVRKEVVEKGKGKPDLILSKRRNGLKLRESRI